MDSPNEKKLFGYLNLLAEALLEARVVGRDNPRLFMLIDAIHNVPRMLCEWKKWGESYEGQVIGELEEYQRQFGRDLGAHIRQNESGIA